MEDSRIPNAGTFVISHEDHTIGNLLRMQLLKDKATVKFAGYRKPHPLQNCIELKIQTTDELRPYDALKTSIKELKDTTSKLKRSFQDQMKKQHVN